MQGLVQSCHSYKGTDLEEFSYLHCRFVLPFERLKLCGGSCLSAGSLLASIRQRLPQL